MIKDTITIQKAINPAEYLSQIDRNDTDADFIHDVSENDDAIHSILTQDEVVGLAVIDEGKNAFLYIYIFPEHRSKGYGTSAIALIEERMKKHEPVNIMTYYNDDNGAAKAFAEKYGYIKKYASDYMVYSKLPFETEPAPVRQYQDTDYPEAHSFYAEAFHIMRLGTGCFPESVPEAPNEQMRKYWSETDTERLVYLMDEEIVGYAHIVGDEISSVSIKPEYQGKGIGEKFLKHIVNKLLDEGHQKLYLYCVVGNNNARHLYDKLGFEKVYRNNYAVKNIFITGEED